MQYDCTKRVFRKFVVKSEVDWRAINVFKCCSLMRSNLLERHFRIVATGEFAVKFEDLPFPPHLIKKPGRKLSFAKKRERSTSRSYSFEEHQPMGIDPLLAQLPNTISRNLPPNEILTKGQVEIHKELANATIKRYTDIIQIYQNYKTLFSAASLIYPGPALEVSKYGAILEVMQDEVNMTIMVLTGHSCPD